MNYICLFLESKDDLNLINKFSRFLQRKTYSLSDIPDEFKKGDYTIIYDDIIFIGHFDYTEYKTKKIIRLKDGLLHSDIFPAIEMISTNPKIPNIKEYYKNGKLHNTKSYAIINECILCSIDDRNCPHPNKADYNGKLCFSCSFIKYCDHIGYPKYDYYLDDKKYNIENWNFQTILGRDKRLHKDIVNIISKYFIF